MKGKEILNSLRYVNTIEFSEAIKIERDLLYFVFKINFISIPIESSKNPQNWINKLANLIKKDKIKYSATDLFAEPVAYIIQREIDEKTHRYCIFPLNKENKEYIKKNKKEILDKFIKLHKDPDKEIIY